MCEDFTWKEIDLKNGFIRLGGQHTKNKTGRVIPLHTRIYLHTRIFNYFLNLPRPIHGGYVFEQRWWNRKKYLKALNLAGLEDFTFNYLWHCTLNNLRLAGNDRYVIKKASGQKTDGAFQRYIFVTEDEMGGMKWLNQKKYSGTVYICLDTYEQSNNV